MTKIIEVPDVAQWEETDSELAKYTIGKLQEENKQLKEQLKYLRKNQYLNQVKWERDFNEYLVKELKTKLDKAIEYLKDNACYENTISELFCDDLNYDNCMELLNILRGEDNE